MTLDMFNEAGPPDIEIAGLRIWVLGRQFGELRDSWDGDWINVLAECSSGDSRVRAAGAILHLSEIQRWLDDARDLHRTMNGAAALDTVEPYLKANIQLRDGRGSLVVEISQDHLTQEHRFTFDIDQSYLPEVINHPQSGWL